MLVMCVSECVSTLEYTSPYCSPRLPFLLLSVQITCHMAWPRECLTKQSPPDTPAASSSSSRQAETATIRTKKFLSNPLLSRKQMVRALILEALTVWLLRSGVVEGPLLLVCAIWPRTRKCAHSSQQPCWCGHPHERSSVVMSILQALPMSRIDAIE